MQRKFKSASRAVVPFSRHVFLFSVLGACLLLPAQLGIAQSTHEFHQVYPVSLSQPLILDVELFQVDLEIAYSRDGQVSISAVALLPAGMNVEQGFPGTRIIVNKTENRLQIRQRSLADDGKGPVKMAYRIDVPYRTEVVSVLSQGKQTITGVMGPVSAGSTTGNIKVTYVSKSVTARAGSGDLDIQVIGGRVDAKTGKGNISCLRAAQGVTAETGDGDVSLMVVGPSEAIVKNGSGRIDARGVRGALLASTVTGEVHVRAVPYEGWQLHSVSGNIRLELPSAAKFEVDASTDAGDLLINREDLEKPNPEARHFYQKANGGGNRIEVHTASGSIVIS